MTVYADEVLVLNALLNWLLLQASVKLAGWQVSRWRPVAAALLGGLYAMAAVLPGMQLLSSLPGRVFSFLLLSGCAFGFRREALRPAAWFFTVCCAFGGLAMITTALLGKGMLLLGGVAYYAVSFRMLVLLGGVVYAVASLIFPRLGQHSGGELVPLRLVLQGHTVSLKALRDTGNTLTDPLTGKPVLVVQGELALQLLPEAGLTKQELEQPSAVLERVRRCCPQAKPRLLPFRAVGTSQGLLLAVRCEELWQEEERKTGSIVAFCPDRLSETGTYQALIGGQYANRKTQKAACTAHPRQNVQNTVYRRSRHSAPAAAPGGGGAAAQAVRAAGRDSPAATGGEKPAAGGLYRQTL